MLTFAHFLFSSLLCIYPLPLVLHIDPCARSCRMETVGMSVAWGIRGFVGFSVAFSGLCSRPCSRNFFIRITMRQDCRFRISLSASLRRSHLRTMLPDLLASNAFFLMFGTLCAFFFWRRWRTSQLLLCNALMFEAKILPLLLLQELNAVLGTSTFYLEVRHFTWR